MKVVRVDDLIHGRPGRTPFEASTQHRSLFLLGQIPQFESDREAVELRLGQRVGALVLDRVVGGQHDERRREFVGDTVDAHLPFGHRLQQRRLGLGRCPVDLVGEKQVGEDRSAAEFETARLHVVDRRAEQVGRQQVRRELHSREVKAQRRGEGPGDQRLAKAGQVLDQHVAAREHGRENQHERTALADHHPPYLVEHRLAVRGRRRSGQSPYSPSYLLQPSQNLIEGVAAGAGFVVAGPRDVLRIHPRPQLGPEQHVPVA